MRHGRLLRTALMMLGCALAASYAPANAEGQAPAGVHPMRANSGTTVLANAQMMTLYTFAKDTPGVSNCYDNCAKNWPPLAAAPDAKPMSDWTIVMRKDGTRQWAYKGMPVYRWIKDTKPGETTGDGMGNGAWKVLTP